MAVIDKIWLKNAEGENIEYDIGSSANNIQFDSENNVTDKIEDLNTNVERLSSSINNLSNNISNHVDVSVVSGDGIHDIRYNNDKIQVYKNRSWIDVSSQLSAEKGISISSDNKIGHSNNVTASTIGSSTNTNGISFDVPYANYDGQGHITGKGNRTHTIPTASSNTAGVIKVDGSTVIINNGVISTSGGATIAGTGLSRSGSTLNHSNSITADIIGSSSATSGITVSVPYATYDAQGHITGKGNRTHTIPTATSDSVGLMRPDNETIFMKPDGSLTTESLYGGALTTGSDKTVKEVIDGYYQKKYSLDDIKSILSVGDIRQANSTDKTIFKVASHIAPRMKIGNTAQAYAENVTVPEMATIKLVIIDFNHSVLKESVGSITNALVTIQMLGTISDGPSPSISGLGEICMNSNNSAAGGLTGSELYSYLNGNFYNACNFKNLIRIVKNPTKLDKDSDVITQCEDKIFLLSATEVDNTIGNEGTQYSYYATTSNIIKYEGLEGTGRKCYQLQLRSISRNGANTFYTVYLYNDMNRVMGGTAASSYTDISPACAL